MKFFCENCARLVAVHDFRVDGLALVLVCPECGAEVHSEPTAHATGLKVVSSDTLGDAGGEAAGAEAEAEVAEAPERDPRFDPPEGTCPKCVTPHPRRALICERCGLVFANANPDHYRPSEAMRETWAEVCARWGESAVHARIIEQAVAQNALAPLARLYRIRLAYAPDDAQAQLRVAQLVERISSQALSTHEPAPNLRWVGWLTLVVFGVLVVLVFWMFR